MKGDFQSQKGAAHIILLILLVLGIIVTVYLVRNPQILKSRADYLSCSKLYIQVSSDKKNWTTNLSLPHNPQKYYVLAKDDRDHNVNCSSNFEAGIDGRIIASPWGSFNSGTDGIARIDIPVIPDGTYRAALRPLKIKGEWSNDFTVTIGGSGSTTRIDPADYFIDTPGFAWMYKGKNADGSYTGTTRLQIEQETNFCGVALRVWRFTKDNPNAYWGAGGSRNLRWLVVSPSFNFPSSAPQYGFNNFRWALGDKRYWMPSQNPIRDIAPLSASPIPANGGGGKYNTKDPKIPAYELIPNIINGPFVHLNEGLTGGAEAIGPDDCPSQTPIGLSSSGTTQFTSWQLRGDMDEISINNPNYKYSGPAYRIDYYEGGLPLLTNYCITDHSHGGYQCQNLTQFGLLRESYYFIKGIGLAQIKIKTFSNYSGNGTPKCVDDPDCLNDSLIYPTQTLTMDQYFQNPPLNINVSNDCQNYAREITTSQLSGYCLKAEITSGNNSSSGYTGYLEAVGVDGAGNATGNPTRWLWVENGISRVDPSIIANLKDGSYKAKFRVWIPNESFSNENRIGQNNLPWSNAINVNLVKSFSSTPVPVPVPSSAPPLPTGAPTSTPTAAPPVRVVNVSVSATDSNGNCSNYSTNIYTSQSLGYCLKFEDSANPNYNGFLESQGTTGETVRKWLQVTNGFVKVDPSLLQSLGNGAYTARFRIWVSSGSNTNTWSNFITVNLQS